MNSIEIPLLVAWRDHRRLFISTAAVVLTGWLGDFLFWSHAPGLSLGIFAALLGFGIWTIGKRTVSGALALAALNLSAVQSGIEICLTNVFCLFFFLVAVAGEAYYAELTGLWARWSEGLLTACLAPFRSLMLLHEWCELRLLPRRVEGAVALQFCDVGAWVANWNVSQWKAHPGRGLVLEYLGSLGPRGWPGLLQVALGTGPIGRQAENMLRHVIAQEQASAAQRDWRSFQSRRQRRAEQLVQTQWPVR